MKFRFLERFLVDLTKEDHEILEEESLRKRDFLENIKETLEKEGVSEVCILKMGILIKNPFPPVSYRPIYFKVKCSYKRDCGYWYICNTDTTTYWVWKSDRGVRELPEERSDTENCKVDNGVLVLPFWISIFLSILILSAVLYFTVPLFFR
jgi:hypothetical protein